MKLEELLHSRNLLIN